MCWSNDEAIKKIAKNNFTVYKLVKFDTFDTCKSSIYKYIYVFEKLHKLEHSIIIKEKNDMCFIDEGFHSYTNLRILSFVEDLTNGCIVECTIPKGAKYYVNNYGEVVSDQIIIHIPTILSDIKQFMENNK